MKERTVSTNLNNILSLVSCAHQYGYNDSILMSSLYDICGVVSDEEIDAYADSFMTEEMQKKGYSKEDRDESKGTLMEWKRRYGS